MDLSVDHSTKLGLNYHGGADDSHLGSDGTSLVYGGLNPLNVDPPSRRPTTCKGSRSACAARTSADDEPPRDGYLDSGVRRGLERAGDERRCQRAGDAAHHRDRQRCGRDQRRREHPSADQRRRRLGLGARRARRVAPPGALGLAAARLRRRLLRAAPGRRHQDQGRAAHQRLRRGSARAHRRDLRARRRLGRPRSGVDHQAQRADDRRRARSADGRHRRLDARRGHPERPQGTHPRATSRCSGFSFAAPRKARERRTSCSSSRRTSSAIRTIFAPSSSARCRSGRSSSIATSSSATSSATSRRAITRAATVWSRTSASRIRHRRSPAPRRRDEAAADSHARSAAADRASARSRSRSSPPGAPPRQLRPAPSPAAAPASRRPAAPARPPPPPRLAGRSPRLRRPPPPAPQGRSGPGAPATRDRSARPRPSVRARPASTGAGAPEASWKAISAKSWFGGASSPKNA